MSQKLPDPPPGSRPKGPFPAPPRPRRELVDVQAMLDQYRADRDAAVARADKAERQRNELLSILKSAVGGVVCLARMAKVSYANQWVEWDNKAREAIRKIEEQP